MPMPLVRGPAPACAGQRPAGSGIAVSGNLWKGRKALRNMDGNQDSRSAAKRKFKCPCCGRFTLTEGRGKYEICPVCFWEGDPVQREDPAFEGGANELSLEEAREYYDAIGVSDPVYLRRQKEEDAAPETGSGGPEDSAPGDSAPGGEKDA